MSPFPAAQRSHSCIQTFPLMIAFYKVNELISFSPVYQPMRRFSAADTGIRDLLLVMKRQAARSDGEIFLKFIFARLLPAPHTADKARLILRNLF